MNNRDNFNPNPTKLCEDSNSNSNIPINNYQLPPINPLLGLFGPNPQNMPWHQQISHPAYNIYNRPWPNMPQPSNFFPLMTSTGQSSFLVTDNATHQFQPNTNVLNKPEVYPNYNYPENIQQPALLNSNCNLQSEQEKQLQEVVIQRNKKTKMYAPTAFTIETIENILKQLHTGSSANAIDARKFDSKSSRTFAAGLKRYLQCFCLNFCLNNNPTQDPVDLTKYIKITITNALVVTVHNINNLAFNWQELFEALIYLRNHPAESRFTQVFVTREQNVSHDIKYPTNEISAESHNNTEQNNKRLNPNTPTTKRQKLNPKEKDTKNVDKSFPVEKIKSSAKQEIINIDLDLKKNNLKTSHSQNETKFVITTKQKNNSISKITHSLNKMEQKSQPKLISNQETVMPKFSTENTGSITTKSSLKLNYAIENNIEDNQDKITYFLEDLNPLPCHFELKTDSLKPLLKLPELTSEDLIEYLWNVLADANTPNLHKIDINTEVLKFDTLKIDVPELDTLSLDAPELDGLKAKLTQDDKIQIIKIQEMQNSLKTEYATYYKNTNILSILQQPNFNDIYFLFDQYKIAKTANNPKERREYLAKIYQIIIGECNSRCNKNFTNINLKRRYSAKFYQNLNAYCSTNDGIITEESSSQLNQTPQKPKTAKHQRDAMKENIWVRIVDEVLTEGQFLYYLDKIKERYAITLNNNSANLDDQPPRTTKK